MRFTATEIAEATGGTVVGPDVVCDGASIDSRTIAAGQLFVPVVDARDGHDFIADAVRAGAGAYLTQRTADTDTDAGSATAIVVDDTAASLVALGRAARDRHTGPVIGITGSVGKTSVKDLTLAAVGTVRRAHASEKSFNNELGVPLTLLNAPDDVQVLIVEMGARGLGHIAMLCEIARPTVGIVTWVGAVHTSEFGTIEAVAAAKGELIRALPADGTAILNTDCPPVAAMRNLTAAAIVTYGDDGDVAARKVALDADLRPSFEVVTKAGVHAATLAVHGVHQVSNALAAIAAAGAVGVDVGEAVEGLADATVSPWRMELIRLPSGARVINDAYNANAISTAAALRSLAALDASRRVAVLGVMAELGDRHDHDHAQIARLCRELGIDLIAYREGSYGVPVVVDFDQALDRLGELDGSEAVLVKGSRVAALEGLVARLRAASC